MSIKNQIESKHFDIQQLADGVYACIHKQGGAAYSNAGIIDIGDRTLVLDALNSMAAGTDLKKAAETLLNRPVDTILLTHPHSDHWIGVSSFDSSTTLLTTEKIREVTLKWGERIVEDYQDPEAWSEWVKEMEVQLDSEIDERIRQGLEKSITSTRYTMSEMSVYQPRYADQTFEGVVVFKGSTKEVEFRSLGRGHSEEDAVLPLPQEGIAFIGDIGFFNCQPFFGFCDIDLYREQVRYFLDSDFEVLVPGHGPVGGKDDLVLQLDYMDRMEELVGNIIQINGTFEDAMQVEPSEPFDQWLYGGMGRLEANVRYLYKHLGGEIPEENQT
jgi:glyoxylase-like metal-dependent hydrolase (beta-lactamase superfamily II)